MTVLSIITYFPNKFNQFYTWLWCCQRARFLTILCSSKMEPMSSTLMDGVQVSAMIRQDIPCGQWSDGSRSVMSIDSSYTKESNQCRTYDVSKLSLAFERLSNDGQDFVANICHHTPFILFLNNMYRLTHSRELHIAVGFQLGVYEQQLVYEICTLYSSRTEISTKIFQLFFFSQVRMCSGCCSSKSK